MGRTTHQLIDLHAFAWMFHRGENMKMIRSEIKGNTYDQLHFFCFHREIKF